MTLITNHLREQLRERLMMLSLTRDVISEETLGEQIDRLLEDILSEQALTATLTLR